MAANEQKQIIEVHIKQDRSIVWLILFGWWYVAWVVFKWSWHVAMWPFRFAAKVGWLTLVKWPWQATVAATRWTWDASVAAWPWVVRSSKAFHERYGAKGWAFAGGIVLVLVILGTIFAH